MRDLIGPTLLSLSQGYAEQCMTGNRNGQAYDVELSPNRTDRIWHGWGLERGPDSPIVADDPGWSTFAPSPADAASPGSGVCVLTPGITVDGRSRIALTDVYTSCNDSQIDDAAHEPLFRAYTILQQLPLLIPNPYVTYRVLRLTNVVLGVVSQEFTGA